MDLLPLQIPGTRIEQLGETRIRGDADYVLYWMTSTRRTESSWALQHAISRASQLKLPLLVVEPLRLDYPWASPRMHRVIVDGMRDNQEAFEGTPIRYHAYVERKAGEGRGMIPYLAERAALVITDYKPGFFTSRMQESAAHKIGCPLERIDDNGILPLKCSEKAWSTAYAFRRYLQRTIAEHLEALPEVRPLAAAQLPRLEKLPRHLEIRWPQPTPELRSGDFRTLDLSGPKPVSGIIGGSRGAQAEWSRFLRHGLKGYVENRNRVSTRGTSGMAPYLHFGHISSSRMVRDVLTLEDWSRDRLSSKTNGSRTGWWGVSTSAEAFLDQIITWRELGHVFCHWVTDFDSYESLPQWALTSLEQHATDPRPVVYRFDELDRGATHDPVWNAAQAQLREEGGIHNYLRMLWGKKILEWSPHPRTALQSMIELNNRYALDGRDPNSYSGIAWCLGRFDRAWGPERPVFGKIRYMSSANTLRKLKLRPYLERWGRSP